MRRLEARILNQLALHSGDVVLDVTVSNFAEDDDVDLPPLFGSLAERSQQLLDLRNLFLRVHAAMERPIGPIAGARFALAAAFCPRRDFGTWR